MTATIDIVRTGARTPVGLTAASTAAAVHAGINRFQEFPFVALDGEAVIVSSDAMIGTRAEGRDRVLALAQSALGEALAPEVIHKSWPGRRSLLVALPEARPGFSARDGSWLADKLTTWLHGHEVDTSVDLIGSGNAGTAHALEHVQAELERDESACFVVLGADSFIHRDTFMWLEDNELFARPPEIRAGFIPGEAAGCLVLSSAPMRKHLRLPRLATITGASTARETLLPSSETGSFGVGMSEAVDAALVNHALPDHAPDTVYTDLNGERYRSEEWAFTVMRTPASFANLEYEAPADCWGETGAAFGVLAATLVVQSHARGYARSTRAMILSGSRDGQRGAVVLHGPKR